MKAFKINRGVITQILEHQLRPVPIDGKETQRMHLMIEWGDEAGQQSFSWEPLLWIYRDQPGVVRDYFKDQRMLDQLLDSEQKSTNTKWFRSEHRLQGSKDRKGREEQKGKDGKPPFIPQSDMTPAERAKAKRIKRFQEADKKLDQNKQAKGLSVASDFFSKNFEDKSGLGFVMPFGDVSNERPSTATSAHIPKIEVIEPVRVPLQADVEMEETKAETDTNIWMQENRSAESKFVSVQDFTKHQRNLKRKTYETQNEGNNSAQGIQLNAQKSNFEQFVTSQFTQIQLEIQGENHISFAEEQMIAQEKNLPHFLGNLFEHTIKEVIAIMKDPLDSGVLYLCRWHQNLDSRYLTPGWVPSEILREVAGSLIVQFYENQLGM